MYLTKEVIYFITVLLIVTSEGCYTNYMKCSHDYTITVTDASSKIDPDFYEICMAVDNAKKCLERDVADCPYGTPEAEDVQQFRASLDNAKGVCTEAPQLSPECSTKKLECDKKAADLSDSVVSSDFTSIALFRGIFKKICPVFYNTTNCLEEFEILCPGVETSAKQAVENFQNTLFTMCGKRNNIHPPFSCIITEQKCEKQAIKALKSLPEGGTYLDVITLMGFCTDMPNAVECFEEVKKRCPDRAKKVSIFLKTYSPVKTQYCGDGNNTVCFQKMPSCIAPYIAAGCENVTRNNVDNFHQCCGHSRDMMTCLKNAGCPDTVFPYGPKALFEAKYNIYCNQYQEYCPGLQACFKPLSGIDDLIDICPKIPSVLSCVTESCKDKPQNGKVSFRQIGSLYREVCQGLDDHQNVTKCTDFSSCTMTTVPSIPGSQPNLQSAIHGGNPLYWCKMAKGTSNCLSLEVSANTECNVTDDVKTDIAILKRKADIMCTDVRDPCPGVGDCVDELFNLGDTGSLLTVCRNMSNFTTCLTSALTTCGESSMVRASYSLSNMGNLFTQACDEFAKFTGSLTCHNIEACFDVDLPTHPPNLNDKLSDQTFWCKTLRSILKCSSSMSSSCDHTEEISTNLFNLYNRVERYCPSQVAVPVKAEQRPENSVSSVVSNTLLILALPVVAFL